MSYAIHDFGAPKTAVQAPAATNEPQVAPPAAPVEPATPSPATQRAIKAALRTMRFAAADRIDAHFQPRGGVVYEPYQTIATLGGKTIAHAAVVEMFTSDDVASFLAKHDATSERQPVLDAFQTELVALLKANGFEIAASEYGQDGTLERVAVTDPTYVAANAAADTQVARLFNDPSAPGRRY